MAREDCPAFGQKCNSCGIPNHFESVCFRRKTPSRTAVTHYEDEQDDIEGATAVAQQSYAVSYAFGVRPSEHSEDQREDEDHPGQPDFRYGHHKMYEE